MPLGKPKPSIKDERNDGWQFKKKFSRFIRGGRGVAKEMRI